MHCNVSNVSVLACLAQILNLEDGSLEWGARASTLHSAATEDGPRVPFFAPSQKTTSTPERFEDAASEGMRKGLDARRVKQRLMRVCSSRAAHH
jgi:hypothetical protein